MHNDNTLEREARYRHLARHLRVHNILAPRYATIVSTVQLLYVEALLLRQRYLLRVEALKVGHLAIERRKVYEGVYLVRKQYRLLLMHVLLVGCHLHEEIFRRYSASRTMRRRNGVIVHIWRRRTIVACGARHLYAE